MSWFINDGLFFKNIAILSAKGCLLMSNSKNEAFKNLNNLVTYDRGVFKYWF